MIRTANISDMYMAVLDSMSTNDKLELISKLSESIRTEKVGRSRLDLRTCFKGDWSNVSTRTLRNARYHGRTIETW